MLDTCDRDNKCNDEELTLFHCCYHGYNTIFFNSGEKKATSISVIMSNKLIYVYYLNVIIQKVAFVISHKYIHELRQINRKDLVNKVLTPHLKRSSIESVITSEKDFFCSNIKQDTTLNKLTITLKKLYYGKNAKNLFKSEAYFFFYQHVYNAVEIIKEINQNDICVSRQKTKKILCNFYCMCLVLFFAYTDDRIEIINKIPSFP